MRGWYSSMVLTGVTIGGVFWILSGQGEPSHCGPCLAGKCAVPSPVSTPVATSVVSALANRACSCPGDAPAIPVIDLVPLQQAPELAPAPRMIPAESNPAAVVVPAGFTEKVQVPAQIPLAQDDSPF